MLSLHLRFDGDAAPRERARPARARPGARTFYLVRTRGRAARIVAALESTRGAPDAARGAPSRAR